MDSINYLYAYEEGARRVLIELYSNLYHDMCSTGKVHEIHSSIFLSLCLSIHPSVRPSVHP